MKSIFLISLFIVTLSGIGRGQAIYETFDPEIYQHGKNLYTLDQLTEVFKQNPDAYYHYIKFREADKTAKLSGGISLSMLVGGIFIIVIIQEPSDCRQRVCISDIEVFGGIMILISPLPGMIGIISQIAATTNKKKAFNLFNQQYTYLPTGNEQISLSFGNTNHGIGLSIRF